MQKGLQKRGVSTIVATVLIVLVTVASVSILWVAVLPLIQQVSFVEDPSVQVKVSPGEYTAYDSNNDLLSVRVTRGSDDADIVGLKFIVDDNGNTVSHVTHDVLGSNSGKVYSFSTTDVTMVNSVGVVPIYEVGGAEVEGSAVNTFSKLPQKDVSSIVESYSPLGHGGLVYVDGLYGYYPFHFDASDYSSTAAHGSLENGALINDEALLLDGIDDYVLIGQGKLDLWASLGVGVDVHELTVSVWIKPDDSNGHYTIFIENGPVYLGTQSGNFRGHIYNGGGSWPQEVTSFGVDDDWQHFVILYDGNQADVNDRIKLYVDGVFDSASSNYNTAYLVSGGSLTGNGCEQIGRYTDGGCSSSAGRYYDGFIDDLAIYTRALSDSEIKAIYNAGRSDGFSE